MVNDEVLEQRPLLVEQRRRIILDRLTADGRVSVADLCGLLLVSEDTVRRDLKELDEAGLLQRVHGGALPRTPASADFDARRHQAVSCKRTLAQLAAPMVHRGEVVFMDGGSTMVEVAAALDPDLDLTVVTNSPHVAEVLAGKPGVEILMIGGRLLKETMTTTGAEAVDAVRGVRAALCLTSPCGLDAEAGVTAMRADEAAVKRAMIEGARRTVAVATADKLGTAAPFAVVPAARLCTLVTDASAMPAAAALSALGIRMVTP